jgi:sulfonate transport system ATP-binding protein
MRDGVIAHSSRLELDRPRAITDPRFVELRAQLLAELGVESGR